ENAAPRFGCKYRTVLGNRPRLPLCVIVEEKESTIALDGPANGAAKLMPKQIRSFNAIRIVEEVIGIEDGVAVEFVSRPVNLITSRPRHERDLGAGATPIFRFEIAGHHLIFLQHVRIDEDQREFCSAKRRIID